MRRKEFLSRLISEVSNYLLEGNPLRMVVSLHQEEDGAHLSFFDDRKRSAKELQYINLLLNPKSHRPELADYYGILAGHGMDWKEGLKLIGWQVKHATVENTDSGLKIDLWLGGDAFNPTKFTLDVTIQPKSKES